MFICGAMCFAGQQRKAGRLFSIALSVAFALNMLLFPGFLTQRVGAEAEEIPAESAKTTGTTAAGLVPAIQEEAAAFIDPCIDEALALIEATAGICPASPSAMSQSRSMRA